MSVLRLRLLHGLGLHHWELRLHILLRLRRLPVALEGHKWPLHFYGDRPDSAPPLWRRHLIAEVVLDRPDCDGGDSDRRFEV